MSNEENKKIVMAWFDAVNSANEKAILDLLSEDFFFKSMYKNPPSMRVESDRYGFAKAPGSMSDKMIKPIKIEPGVMTAEEDRVAVEAESYGEMTNGKVYNNVYQFLFWVKNGKLTRCHEYSCSYTAYDVFGEYVEGMSF